MLLPLAKQALALALQFGAWGAPTAAAQAPPEPCVPGDTTLCIDEFPGDRRFEIQVRYQTVQGGGLAGDGHAIALDSLGVTQGGLFWFFGADNPEVLIKVVNGCGVNQRFWVFSSAGTNVGFTITVRDSVTGAINTYANADLTAALPVQDTAAFPCAVNLSPAAGEQPEPLAAVPVPRSRADDVCVADATTLCISDQPGDQRFKVRVHYETAQSGGLSGDAHAVALGSLGVAHGGLFWFFGADNPEMLIKVINGCGSNDKFWVFSSAGTNVGLTVTVTDTRTGESVVYTNPDLTAAAPVQDTSALPCGSTATTAGRMAFVARQASVSHIYLMDVDGAGVGSNPTRLTSDAEAENYPSWSPDGTRLTYQRDLDGAAIYVINADGTGQRRLSPTPGFDVTASWSPDGTKIVYVRLLEVPQPNTPPRTDIRIVNADGTGDHAVLPDTRFSVEPRWSVGDRLVFMSLMGGGSELQIYVMNVDGSDIQQLTTVAANHGDPVWSPDGTRITFGSDREGAGKLNVFVMNADGSGQQALTHFAPPYEAGDTNWSSDGNKIAFQYDIDGMKQSDPDAHAEVWTMNADGSGATSTGVACSNVGCAPRWQPK
jgi:Tol biopolymer transport system component